MRILRNWLECPDRIGKVGSSTLPRPTKYPPDVLPPLRPAKFVHRKILRWSHGGSCQSSTGASRWPSLIDARSRPMGTVLYGGVLESIRGQPSRTSDQTIEEPCAY